MTLNKCKLCTRISPGDCPYSFINGLGNLLFSSRESMNKNKRKKISYDLRAEADIWTIDTSISRNKLSKHMAGEVITSPKKSFPPKPKLPGLYCKISADSFPGLSLLFRGRDSLIMIYKTENQHTNNIERK